MLNGAPVDWHNNLAIVTFNRGRAAHEAWPEFADAYTDPRNAYMHASPSFVSIPLQARLPDRLRRLPRWLVPRGGHARRARPWPPLGHGSC
jgi:hypothetical protein